VQESVKPNVKNQPHGCSLALGTTFEIGARGGERAGEGKADVTSALM